MPSKAARAALICISLLGTHAMAQTASGDSGWTGTLGLGPVFVPKYPGGKQTQILPLPIAYVEYKDWFYVDLFRAGAYVWGSQDKKQGIAFSVEPRMGFTSGDGPKLTGMAKRRSGVSGGPTYNAEGDWGAVSVGYFADLSDASRGGYFDALYNRRLLKDDHWDLSGTIQVSSWNSKMTNYYFGVKAEEATAARPLYTAGASTQATLWLTGQYNLSREYAAMFGGNVTRLGSAAAASPIVERRLVPLLYIGFGVNL